MTCCFRYKVLIPNTYLLRYLVRFLLNYSYILHYICNLHTFIYIYICEFLYLSCTKQQKRAKSCIVCPMQIGQGLESISPRIILSVLKLYLYLSVSLVVSLLLLGSIPVWRKDLYAEHVRAAHYLQKRD